MPKFLVHASYTADGLKGLLKSSASERYRIVEETLTGLGGRLEAFYYTFGESDAVIIMDLPDYVTASALCMAVNASGALRSKTTILIPITEADEAIKRHVQFRPPGA